MKRGFKLRLEPAEGGSAIEAEFGKHDILFLISNSKGPALCSEPDRCGLIHAVFLFQKGNVFAIALRDDLYLKTGCTAQLKNKQILRLGSRKLRVVFATQCIAGRKKVSWLILALLMLSAVLASTYYGRINAKKIQPVIAERTELRMKSGTEFVEEAKMHMRDGMFDQARLALMEEVDRNPQNAEALKLLNALKGDKFTAEFDAHTNELEIIGEAKDSYEMGKRLMRERDFAKAHEVFENAFKKISSIVIAVPFKPALLEANRHAISMLEAEMLPKLFKAEQLFNAASQKETKEAINLLSQALAISEAVTKSLPHISEASSLHMKIRDEIRAASQRWLFAAQAVERLEDCRKAASEYERIADVLQNVDPNIASIAKKRASRCRPSKGGGL